VLLLLLLLLPFHLTMMSQNRETPDVFVIVATNATILPVFIVVLEDIAALGFFNIFCFLIYVKNILLNLPLIIMIKTLFMMEASCWKKL